MTDEEQRKLVEQLEEQYQAAVSFLCAMGFALVFLLCLGAYLSIRY
jgi:hypothetical protein